MTVFTADSVEITERPRKYFKTFEILFRFQIFVMIWGYMNLEDTKMHVLAIAMVWKGRKYTENVRDFHRGNIEKTFPRTSFESLSTAKPLFPLLYIFIFMIPLD